MRWEQVVEGAELPVLPKPAIERIQLVRYAGASGDFNRIHVEEGFAREAGYDSVIAHGMLVMGFLGQLVTDWAGSHGRVAAIDCRFKAVSFPGDVITVTGRVTRKHDAERRADLELQATDANGQVKATGTATVAF
jgi:acyl dehydratase